MTTCLRPPKIEPWLSSLWWDQVLLFLILLSLLGLGDSHHATSILCQNQDENPVNHTSQTVTEPGPSNVKGQENKKPTWCKHLRNYGPVAESLVHIIVIL